MIFGYKMFIIINSVYNRALIVGLVTTRFQIRLSVVGDVYRSLIYLFVIFCELES